MPIFHWPSFPLLFVRYYNQPVLSVSRNFRRNKYGEVCTEIGVQVVLHQVPSYKGQSDMKVCLLLASRHIQQLSVVIRGPVSVRS